MCPFALRRWVRRNPCTYLGKNGGDEETRTRDLRRDSQASARLLRRYHATDFLDLVAHRPNVANRDVGRVGKPLATYYE
jgi:hypothetical protein